MSYWANQQKNKVRLTGLLILIVVGFGIFFLVTYNPPTCSDNIQNQDEAGIDCGGSCSKQCVLDNKEAVSLWVRTFEKSKGLYSAVAYIDNPNIDSYIPSIQFEIVFYDDTGALVTRASEFTTIMPAGVTPVFIENVVSGEREISSADFRFTTEPEFEPFNRTLDLSITNIEEIYDNEPSVSAVVNNLSNADVRDIDFVAVIFDEDGNAINASRTYIRRLDGGSSNVLNYTWFRPFELNTRPCETGRCEIPVNRVEILPVFASL